MCNERLQWRTAEHNTGECNCGVTTPRCFRSTETFIRSSHHTSSPASASGNPVQPRREVQLRRFTRVPACVVVTSQWVLHVVAHMAQEGEALLHFVFLSRELLRDEGHMTYGLRYCMAMGGSISLDLLQLSFNGPLDSLCC